MSERLDNHFEQLTALTERGPVVTRTRRLARAVLAAVSTVRSRSGKTVFETPEVLPVESWFSELWNELDEDRRLLGATAERLVWREIIAEDLDGRAEYGAADPGALARSAMSAWMRIHRWHEPHWESALGVSTPDVAAFKRWRDRFGERLEGEGLRTQAELPRLLADAVDRRQIAAPGSLALLGFERTEPALRRLIDSLAETGAGVLEPVIGNLEKPGTISVVAAEDVGREVRRAARSIRADLDADPSLRIGVLLGDASGYRAVVERIFTAELDPPSLVPTEDGRLEPPRRVFDLAGAPALRDYALIAHAFDLLRLAVVGNDFERVSRVLLAPFPRAGASDDDESAARAGAEVLLRRRNLMNAGSGQLAAVCRQAGARRIAAAFDKLEKDRGREPGSALPSRWAEIFDRRLRSFGWPGSGLDRNTDEGVAFARWREAMETLALLDPILGEIRVGSAVAELEDIAGEIAVQAPSRGTGVQAMSLLDAAGLAFDKVYVLGLTAANFPEALSPHPLLPAVWQRESRLPLASPEAEAEFAESIWKRVLHCAGDVVVSWPGAIDRGEPQTPSAVLGEAAVGAEADPELALPFYAGTALPEASEPWDKGETPPSLIRTGGTGVIADQSACPFRAFAKHRLRLEALEDPEPEPTPARRGELLHATLAHAWKRIETSAALRAAGDDELSSILNESANAALEDLRAAVAGNVRRAPLIQWLVESARAWLAYERDERLGEFSVIGTEMSANVPLGTVDGEPAFSLEGLSIDRVDAFEDGAVMVLDYKTSSTKKRKKQWEEDRPEEPQVPIYALALQNDGRRVAAAAFANIAKRDDMNLAGVSDRAVVAKTLVAPKGADDDYTLDETIDTWRSVLDSLAEDLARGNAQVSPRKQSDDCKFCGMDPLCRRFELLVEVDEEGTDGE